MSISPDQSVHLQDADEDGASTIRQPSLHFSDNEDDDDLNEHTGDYSSRMEELLSEGEESDTPDDEDELGDEGFLYTGMDAADTSTGYGDQLRDVLGPDHEDSDVDANEVELSLLIHPESSEKSFDNEEPLVSLAHFTLFTHEIDKFVQTASGCPFRHPFQLLPGAGDATENGLARDERHALQTGTPIPASDCLAPPLIHPRFATAIHHQCRDIPLAHIRRSLPFPFPLFCHVPDVFCFESSPFFSR